MESQSPNVVLSFGHRLTNIRAPPRLHPIDEADPALVNGQGEGGRTWRGGVGHQLSVTAREFASQIPATSQVGVDTGGMDSPAFSPPAPQPLASRAGVHVDSLGVPGVATRAQHVRSGVFAGSFGPIALMIMGLAVTDLQAESAVGQPLSSSEGLVGLLIATLLLALIAINSEESSAGMVVTNVAALIVGGLQMAGIVRSPTGLLSMVTGSDASAAMKWSLYPLSVFVVCVGASVAVILTRRRARIMFEQWLTGEIHPQSAEELAEAFTPSRAHYWARTLVMVGSLALVSVAVLLVLTSAPTDTLPVAARGLTGVVADTPFHIYELLGAALCLGVVALLAKWSVLGPQLAAWWLMIIPFYFVVPVWTSLTGAVATPGESALTALSLSAPVVTALGLVLSATTLGAHWTRRFVHLQLQRAVSLPIAS